MARFGIGAVARFAAGTNFVSRGLAPLFVSVTRGIWNSNEELFYLYVWVLSFFL